MTTPTEILTDAVILSKLHPDDIHYEAKLTAILIKVIHEQPLLLNMAVSEYVTENIDNFMEDITFLIEAINKGAVIDSNIDALAETLLRTYK